MNEQKILNTILKKELGDLVQALRSLSTPEAKSVLFPQLLEFFKGNDGKTPEKGADYMTEQDLAEIAQKASLLIKPPKDADEEKIRKQVQAVLIRHFRALEKVFMVDYKVHKKAMVGTLEQSLEKAEKRIVEKLPKGMTEKQVEKLINKAITGAIKEHKSEIKKIVIKEKATIDDLLNDPAKIARALEKLKGKERLSAKAIKGLPQPSTFGTVVSTGGTAGVQVANLSSQCDGSTTSFELPAYSAVLMVIITGWSPNGVLNPTTDFTTPDSTHIELTGEVSAPVLGTTLLALYIPA